VLGGRTVKDEERGMGKEDVDMEDGEQGGKAQGQAKLVPHLVFERARVDVVRI